MFLRLRRLHYSIAKIDNDKTMNPILKHCLLCQMIKKLNDAPILSVLYRVMNEME